MERNSILWLQFGNASNSYRKWNCEGKVKVSQREQPQVGYEISSGSAVAAIPAKTGTFTASTNLQGI